MTRALWLALIAGSFAGVLGCGDETPAATTSQGGSAAPGGGSAIAGSAGAALGGGGANAGGGVSGSAGRSNAGASGGGVGGAGGANGAGGTAGTTAAAGTGGSAGSAGAIGIDHDAHGVIVVLGSSTAAGTGPSKPEFAWVERYRTYLKTQFKNFELLNLAVGGYTTYQMQPSDYAPPQGRPAPVPEHNITLALSHTPNAIIINMPTNDAAGNIPLPEQMANYARVTELAAAHGASCWVTTSQPRNFGDTAQRMSLMATRDAIKTKYGDHALDFWTQFAETDGTIKPMYNSGDGIHMNDAAHALLAEQVIAAKLPEAVLTK